MSAMASPITGVSIVVKNKIQEKRYSSYQIPQIDTWVRITLDSGADKKTSKLRVNGLFKGNSPVTGEFHAQKGNNTENASIWFFYFKYIYTGYNQSVQLFYLGALSKT